MIKQIKHNLKCGLHSNIPLCCILWYILFTIIFESIINFLKFKPLCKLYLLYVITFNRWLVIKKQIVYINGKFCPGLSVDYEPKKVVVIRFEHHPCPFCLIHQFYGVKMKKCKCYDH
jgi:hypothetical protein